MVRTQVQLTEEQAETLRELAENEGASMAELVRQAVDGLIRQRGEIGREERKRRALTAVGRFSSGLGDIAREHDRYLAEAFRE
ncbi:MAG: ribbon-helix-helix protein, CopG family [Thermoanaerobaculia bacterium]